MAQSPRRYTVPVQSVRSEVQQIAAILLCDRTASQPARLLKERYFWRPPPASALAAVRPARPPPTTTYSLHRFLPTLVSQLGRERYPVCDSVTGFFSGNQLTGALTLRGMCTMMEALTSCGYHSLSVNMWFPGRLC